MNVNALLVRQEGVLTRQQALACGLTLGDIQRLLRRREWRRLSPGVFVNHTGPLAETQREWAALLVHRRAALAGRTALRRAGITTGSDHAGSRRKPDIDLVIPHADTPQHRPGVVVTRRRDFAEIVHPSRMPPTVRIEEAVLDVAQGAGELQAVAILSDACRSRQTTAERLRRAAARRSRLRQRAFLISVLDDAASGTHSLLEWRYRRDVEGRHKLTTAARQSKPEASKSLYRDVHYDHYGFVVELDGRLGHDLALDRWADLDRDLTSAATGVVTVRLGWVRCWHPAGLHPRSRGYSAPADGPELPRHAELNAALGSSSGTIRST